MSVVWKQIPQFPNYEANEWSQIRNRKTQRILAPNPFQQVKLSHNGKKTNKQVYHLSLMAFFPELEPQETVDHIIEGDTSNNHISNLHWLSRRDNSRKSNFLHPRRPGKGATRNVQQWTADGTEMIAEFASTTKASEILGVDKTGIRRSIDGTQKSAGGFQWRWKPDPDLPGEVWATSERLQQLLKRSGMTETRSSRIRISNLGRIQAVNGRRSFGSKEHKYPIYRKFAMIRVHKLVWATFGDRLPGPKEVICHNDSIPLDADGCVSNAFCHLRLGTQSENMKESYAVGRRGLAHKRKHHEIK
jgi:hypothetical protein